MQESFCETIGTHHHGRIAELLLNGGFELPNIPPKQPNVASLDPPDWYIFHSDDVPIHPSADSTGAWSFTIPKPDGHVNYIQTPFNATEVLHNVTITFEIESDAPKYIMVDPTDHLPATVHLFFEQKNDDGRNPNGRWWATWSKYDFGSQDNSTITFVIPLTPDQWSNVISQRDATAMPRSQTSGGSASLAAANSFLVTE